jgi:hypothetical protein
MSSNILISLRPENVIRQLPWRVDSKAASGFLLLLATFSLVGWLYLTQASVVTTTSYRIDELRLELDRIRNENAALNLEIAQLKALTRIEVRAREMGLTPTTNVRYLPVADYPISPKNEDGPIPGLGRLNGESESTISNNIPLTWWDEFLDNMAAWVEG